MLISEVRLLPALEADLRWWFCEADGDMGARSALGRQLDRLAEGRVSAGQLVDAHEVALHQVANVDRARRIEVVLRLLELRHHKTLRAALGPALPAAGVEGLDELGTATLPLALLLLTAERQRVSRKTLTRWVRPPVAETLPDDATKEQVAAAKTAHDQAVKTWREQSKAGLTDLRREATVALVAASHAYSEATRSAPRHEGRRIRIV